MHTPLISLGSLNDTTVYVNKPKIIRNSGELTYLDYLPTKQKMRNISRMWTHEPLVYWSPLKTLEYILNEPSMMENDGKLRKREYTLLLKHNMSNISKMQWWMPLMYSYPNADSKGHYDAHSKVRQHRAYLQLRWYTNEL